MRRSLFPGLLGLVVALAGCHSSAFAHAEAQDSPDAWRSFLRDHDDEGKEVEFARKRLAALSWKAAKAEDSPRAYRRFAEEFPEDDHHDDAVARLTELRYAQAERQDAPAGFEGFLEDDPKGPFADEARLKLANLEFAAAKRASGPRPLDLYLARFPQGPHRVEAQALEDDRAFEEARAGGSPALRDYLAAHPQGAHRVEAERLVRVARATAMLLEWRFAEAEAEVRALGPVPEALALSRRLEAGRREAELARLERISNLPTPALEELQALALALRPPDEPSVSQLAEGLSAVDPRRRWETAERLGRTGSVYALDPLLSAASRSRFWRVRLAAASAFEHLASILPKTVRDEELGGRLERLSAEAASADLDEQVALIQLALGRMRPARDAFVQAARYTPDDLFALWGLLECDRRAGAEGEGLADARSLASAADGDSSQRATDEGTPLLLAERQLCGLTMLEDAAGKMAEKGNAELAAPIRAHAERLRARLELAEQRLRLERPEASGCDASGQTAEVSAPVARRLEAVRALVGKLTGAPLPVAEAVRAVLAETSALDGSARVRSAAAAALATR